jgi:DeoR family fructose operon transcriptional repressor
LIHTSRQLPARTKTPVVVPGALTAEERLRWLASRLDRDGAVGIVPAAAELGVSEMTIRRDLAELEDRGTARRVRGGAVPVVPRSFAERNRTQARAKAVIAQKLLRLVPADGAVAFDASSTVLRVASALEGGRGLLAVTNGRDTFEALQGRPGLVPVLTGGQVDPATGSLVGPVACRAAAQFTVSRLIASAAALDAGVGATEATLDDAEVKRALAEGAGEVVLAVDSSKLGHRSVAVALGWDEIDVLVTELAPSDRRLERFKGLADIV